MFLPLAERMVEKMVKEEKIEAEAEVSGDPPSPEALVSCGQRVRALSHQDIFKDSVWSGLSVETN